jgi:hypothetical protein
MLAYACQLVAPFFLFLQAKSQEAYHTKIWIRLEHHRLQIREIMSDFETLVFFQVHSLELDE